MLRVWNRAARGTNLFWTQASTAMVQENFNYWDLLQFSQIQMIVEYGRAVGKPQSWIDTFKGEYLASRKKELEIARLTLPPDFQAIQIVDGAKGTGLAWYTTTAEAMGKKALALSFRNVIATTQAYDGNTFKEPTMNYGDWNPPADANDWRLPRKAEVEVLIKAQADSGMGFPAWLAQATGYCMPWNLQMAVDRAPDTPMKRDVSMYMQMSPQQLQQQKLEMSYKLARQRLWDSVRAITRTRYQVETEPVADEAGNIQVLLVNYWNPEAHSLWWTGDFKPQQDNNENTGGVMRVYQPGNHVNLWWKNDPLGTTVYVFRFDAGQGKIAKDPLAWLQDSGFDTESTTNGMGKGYPEILKVWRKKGDSGYLGTEKVPPDAKYRFIEYNGVQNPFWLGAVVIAVRPVGPDEMKKYFYLDSEVSSAK